MIDNNSILIQLHFKIDHIFNNAKMLGLLFNFKLGYFVLQPDLRLTSVTLFKTTLIALQMTHLHSIDLNGNKKPPGELNLYLP